MIDPRALPSAVALEDVLARGRAELEAGHVQGALRTFDAALRIKPTYAPAWRAKGRALRVAGDATAALDCYAEALRHEPEDETSWFGLALTLHALGRRKEEVLAYDELLRREPRNVAAWMNKGVALHEAARFEAALACYARILAMRPEVAAAWNNRGAALLRLRRFEDALVAFDEALALDPAFADAAANRRTALAQLRRDEPEPARFEFPEPGSLSPSVQARILANLGLAALDAFRRSLPVDAEDFLALGTALLDEGNPRGAIAAFEKAATLGGSPRAGLGKLLAMEVLRHPETTAEASRLLAAFPGDTRVSIATARARESAGDLEGALAALDPVVSERPELAWIWNWKGLLELQLGRSGDARMSFEGATASDPGDADAWANLAAALHHEGDLKGALAACDRAFAADSDHPAAWNNRGVILASLGRRDAEAAFRRAAKETDDVAIMMNRARLAEARGRPREAMELYKRVLERAPDARDALAGRRRAQGRMGAAARRKSRGRRAKAPRRSH